MENVNQERLGPHVIVTPETLVVDFDAIREETIERYGFAEKPAGEPWIIGKVNPEDFALLKAEEERFEAEEENANQ